MTEDDLPPELRQPERERLPLSQIPLELPQEEPPAPPSAQTNEREIDPFLRHSE